MSQFFRVCAAALALSSLSFAAGVAGDLTRPPPVSGVSVVVRIPPPLPLDSPRAGPLAPLRTAAAEARPVRARRPVLALISTNLVLAEHEMLHTAPDAAQLLAAKAEPVKLG